MRYVHRLLHVGTYKNMIRVTAGIRSIDYTSNPRSVDITQLAPVSDNPGQSRDQCAMLSTCK